MLRETTGMSRCELAARLDVAYWAVAKYDLGERYPDQTIRIVIESQ